MERVGEADSHEYWDSSADIGADIGADVHLSRPRRPPTPRRLPPANRLLATPNSQVPSDLVKLGFVPAGDERAILESGVVDFLTYSAAPCHLPSASAPSTSLPPTLDLR